MSFRQVCFCSSVRHLEESETPARAADRDLVPATYFVVARKPPFRNWQKLKPAHVLDPDGGDTIGPARRADRGDRERKSRRCVGVVVGAGRARFGNQFVHGAGFPGERDGHGLIDRKVGDTAQPCELDTPSGSNRRAISWNGGCFHTRPATRRPAVVQRVRQRGSPLAPPLAS